MMNEHVASSVPTLRSIALVGFVMAAGCGPVTPSLDIDGGFPDAQVVVVPPTRVADNRRDEHLFLSIGFTPATDVPGRFDVTAYDWL